MTIQIRIHDGISIKTRTYRGVFKYEYSLFLSGFYMQKEFCKWGTITQLKGKQQILIAKFGKETI